MSLANTKKLCFDLQGDFRKAFERECLKDEVISDHRRPLFKVYIYTSLFISLWLIIIKTTHDTKHFKKKIKTHFRELFTTYYKNILRKTCV